MNVFPFQCQTRACEPPLGRQRALSVGRKTAVSTRMSEPTAATGGKMNAAFWKTSFHALPLKAKTAHCCSPQHVGAATVTTIDRERAPVNGPQSTSAGGRKNPFRWLASMSLRAAAFEQAVGFEAPIARAMRVDAGAPATTTNPPSVAKPLCHHSRLVTSSLRSDARHGDPTRLFRTRGTSVKQRLS